jgi:hypothetical protein
MSLIPPSLTVSTAQRLATTILYPLCVKCWGVAARRSEPTVVHPVVQKGLKGAELYCPEVDLDECSARCLRTVW